MHKLADLLTARALRLALAPDWDCHAAAAELASIATDHPNDVELALARIDHHLVGTSDRVSENAARSLAQALSLVRGRAA